MLVAKNLSYHFSKDKELNFPDWKVEDGGHALILGRSGSGKTTLLHLLSGLLKPTQGNVQINDTELASLSTAALDQFRGAHFGFVFQKPHLIAALTVEENIRLASFLGKETIEQDSVRQLLEELNIADLAHRKIHEISQGQAQRVAIARAVVNQPDVIFGDEPTASLDDQSCTAVVDLLKKQATACNAMLILATHDQRVKDEFSNRLIL